MPPKPRPGGQKSKIRKRKRAIKLRPIPWITTKAVHFLTKYLQDNPNASVLEFGSGASTMWFSSRVKHLVAVEHSPEWYKINGRRIVKKEGTRVDYILHPIPYHTVAGRYPDASFDLILIDGRNRKACFLASLKKLKSGGVLMLDNAERKWYHPVFERVKDWKYVTTLQTKPDACGFCYDGWRTDWWIKP